eukprot:5652551-Amphidinium_carterae.1
MASFCTIVYMGLTTREPRGRVKLWLTMYTIASYRQRVQAIYNACTDIGYECCTMSTCARTEKHSSISQNLSKNAEGKKTQQKWENDESCWVINARTGRFQPFQHKNGPPSTGQFPALTPFQFENGRSVHRN